MTSINSCIFSLFHAKVSKRKPLNVLILTTRPPTLKVCDSSLFRFLRRVILMVLSVCTIQLSTLENVDTDDIYFFVHDVHKKLLTLRPSPRKWLMMYFFVISSASIVCILSTVGLCKFKFVSPADTPVTCQMKFLLDFDVVPVRMFLMSWLSKFEFFVRRESICCIGVIVAEFVSIAFGIGFIIEEDRTRPTSCRLNLAAKRSALISDKT